MRTLTAAYLFCVAFLGAGAGEQLLVARVQSGEPFRYRRIEWAIDGVGPVAKPLDPARITLDLELDSPAGDRLVVPCYAYRKVGVSRASRARGGGGGWLPDYDPVGPWRWAARFCPAEAGTYRGRVVERREGREAAASPVVFTVAAAEGRGFIRLAPRNPQAFAHDDGSLYFPVGENLCFVNPRHGQRDRLAAYRAWLDRLQANGANYIRLWLGAAECFGLERGQPYDYDQRTGHLVDEIQRLCEERGIAIKYCFDYVRTLRKDGYYYRSDYPYLRENGGPARTMAEMLALPSARRQWQALQRYIVARWGASTTTFTWELWNEMDETDAGDGLVVAWSREMAAHLKRIDPHRHLVSTSLGSGGDLPELWALPELDYANYHDYGGSRHVGRSQQDIYFAPLVGMAERHGKAVMLNEAGLVDEAWNAFGPASHPRFVAGGPKDTRGLAFHETLWAGVFGSGCGTGMAWWWDSTVDAFDLYPQFKVVRDFVAGLPLQEARTVAGRPRCDRDGVGALARTGPWGCIVWVFDRGASWRPVVLAGHQPQRVEGVGLELPLPGPGAYSVRFVDPWTGAEVARLALDAESSRPSVRLPAFTIDLLVRVERR